MRPRSREPAINALLSVAGDTLGVKDLSPKTLLTFIRDSYVVVNLNTDARWWE
jgi:hypothetical protein